MVNPFLIGEAIYLRPLELTDAPRLMPWVNDAEVRRTIFRHLPVNLRAEEEWLDHLYRDGSEVALGIARQSDDALIGSTGLHAIDYKNRHASFGIVIGEATERRKGYGTAAARLIVGYGFDTLNLHRVWLHVYDNNPHAIHVYDKLGFRREGVLRQDSYRDGVYRDTIVMAVLRSEWGNP